MQQSFHGPIENESIEIDHVVLAARSRAEAGRELERAGLGIARSRDIPGLGLSNLIVPLRTGQFLEIHYPNGETPAPGAPPLLEFDQQALAAHPSVPLIPMAWLVLIGQAERLRELAAAHNEAVMDVPGQGPDFPPYSLVGFGTNFKRRWLPALIHWPKGTPSLSAAHRHEPIGITRIDVAGPAQEIRSLCGGIPRGLRAIPGTAGPQRVEVGFTDGSTYTFGLIEN